MSLPNWLSRRSTGVRGSLLKLYIMAVIVVRVWGEYYLANFVVVLNGPTIDRHNVTTGYQYREYHCRNATGDYVYRLNVTGDHYYTRSGASAIINAKDGFAGMCGFIGAILLDVCLTDYGLIFFSSLIYGVGLLLILLGLNDTSSPNFIMAVIGLFMSGAGNLTLMNSSNNMADAKKDSNQNDPDAKKDSNQNDPNLLTNSSNSVADAKKESNQNDPNLLANSSNNLADAKRKSNTISFIQFVVGNNTEINGSVIIVVLIKYATKVMFIVVAILIDRSPQIKEYLEYARGADLLIPTIGLLLMAVVSLVHVKTFVKPAHNRGTPLKYVIRVCVTAFRKRHLDDVLVEMLHKGNPEHPLAHTDGLRFLDKAAIVPEKDGVNQGLCTVTQVEETKCLFRMVPVCMSFLLYGLVNSVGTTFFLLQGNEMNAKLGSNLKLPLQTLIIFGEISGLVTEFLYNRLISERLNEPAKMYASLIRYAIGIVLATFCCTVASWTGTDKGPKDSVFWLTPQFLLFGAMNEMTRDGIKSFFQDQLPSSLKIYDSVFTDYIIGVGAGLCAALIYATHRRIDRDENCPNPSFPFRNLGVFYRILTVVCFVILSAYMFVAIMYRYQGTKDAQSNQEKKDAHPIQEVP